MESIRDILEKGGATGPGSGQTKNSENRPGDSDRSQTPQPNAVECSEEERLEQERARHLAMRASGLLPETRERLRLSTIKPRPQVKGLLQAKKAAEMVVSGDLRWLTLCGKPGTGKTHLAVGIGWEWLEQGRRCRYAEVPTLLERLRRCYGYSLEQAMDMKEPRFEDLFSSYQEAPLLILDDMGVENLTPWAGEKLDMLVNYRWLRELPLVVTTNVPLKDLPPRVADRLEDRRLGKVITLDGPSYRTSG